MNIQEKIKNWIKKTLKIESDFVLAHPKNIKNGDYSFFAPAGKADEFAEALRQAQGDLQKQIEEVKVAGNFINLYLSKDFFAETVSEINKEREDYGKNNLFKKEKTIVEYTDPNIMKPFHIGHFMSNAIGESISRLCEWNGAKVIRANYYSDSGLSIAKAVWGVKEKQNEMPNENASLPEKANFLGKCYAYGVTQFEADENITSKIREINKKIFDRSDDDVNKIYDLGKRWSLANFDELYKRLDSQFDWLIGESEVVENGRKIVLDFLKKEIFEESEGAIVFKGEKFDPKLHTRVFINKDGLPTYEAKEIGLTKKKFEKYNPNKSIVITANEQNDYFKVVIGALSLIDKEIAEKTKHLSHGMLRLPSGKMSSRTGDIITAEALIEQVKEKVLEKIKDREFSDIEKQEIAEVVAIGAIKYSILRQAIGGDIIFDFDKSISFEGDSGPYLQYAHTRAKSILEKAPHFAEASRGKQVERPKDFEITELERHLYRFPEVVERAGVEYAPHYIVTYLTELASIFNNFYANNKIIDESDPSSPYKIALTQAVAHIIKSGLHLLGIKVPEKM